MCDGLSYAHCLDGMVADGWHESLYTYQWVALVCLHISGMSVFTHTKSLFTHIKSVITMQARRIRGDGLG